MNRPRFFVFAIAAAPLVLASPAWADGGVAGFLRSVTGALNSQSNTQTQQPQTTTVLGVRGMDDVEVAQNTTNGGSGNELQLIEGWASNQGEAEKLAKAKGLVARDVTLNSTSGSQP